MAVRKIVYHPAQVLRKPTPEVTEFNDELQQLIDDMFETMYGAGNGVGLAANQIGVSLRLAVLDVSEDQSQPIVMINPEIVAVSDTLREYQEGCLSVPGVYETVQRPTWVTVKALDRQGKSFEITGDGLLGECLQHEIHHLMGKLYVDLLSPIKRQRTLQKSLKFMKQQPNE
jgi:peptide deformylase